MPLTSDLGGKNYTLGRGRVFFDRFPPNVNVTEATRGAGERYLGNTPEFNTASSSEDLDHYDSDSGIRTKDDSVPLQFDRTGGFTCDNMDDENLAMLFLSADGVVPVVQVAATAVIEVVPATNLGVFIQLGQSASLPSGVRSISNVIVKKGSPSFATTVAALNNYEVDEALGRIYIRPNAVGITKGDILQITYDVGVSTRTQLKSGSKPIYGSIRFVADNPKGPNRDYYFPYVKLSPDGDFNLKGDDWQAMSFTMEILKKASNIEAMYVDGRPSA